jgi:hypothetical protein
MSRESMVSILLGEVYQATSHTNPIPMNPRRIKRLLRLDDNTETLNRCAGAWMNRRYKEEAIVEDSYNDYPPDLVKSVFDELDQ